MASVQHSFSKVLSMRWITLKGSDTHSELVNNITLSRAHQPHLHKKFCMVWPTQVYSNFYIFTYQLIFELITAVVIK